MTTFVFGPAVFTTSFCPLPTFDRSMLLASELPADHLDLSLADAAFLAGFVAAAAFFAMPPPLASRRACSTARLMSLPETLALTLGDLTVLIRSFDIRYRSHSATTPQSYER